MNSHLIHHYEPLQLHHKRIMGAQAALHPSVTKGINHKYTREINTKEQSVIIHETFGYLDT